MKRRLLERVCKGLDLLLARWSMLSELESKHCSLMGLSVTSPVVGVASEAEKYGSRRCSENVPVGRGLSQGMSLLNA